MFYIRYNYMFRRLTVAIFRLYMKCSCTLCRKYFIFTNKYSCVRPVHTLYISYFIEHNGDVGPITLLWFILRQYLRLTID